MVSGVVEVAALLGSAKGRFRRRSAARAFFGYLEPEIPRRSGMAKYPRPGPNSTLPCNRGCLTAGVYRHGVIRLIEKMSGPISNPHLFGLAMLLCRSFRYLISILTHPPRAGTPTIRHQPLAELPLPWLAHSPCAFNICEVQVQDFYSDGTAAGVVFLFRLIISSSHTA